MELKTQTRARDLLPATVLSLAASLWPQQSGPDGVEPTLTLSHSSHLAPGACLCWTIIAEAQTGKHKNNCPLLWPQQGVGHLDSSEPSTPQKRTTMRLRPRRTPPPPTDSWDQLQINTHSMLPFSMKVKYIHYAGMVRPFEGLPRLHVEARRNLAAHFPLLQSEEPHTRLTSNNWNTVAGMK